MMFKVEIIWDNSLHSNSIKSKRMRNHYLVVISVAYMAVLLTCGKHISSRFWNDGGKNVNPRTTARKPYIIPPSNSTRRNTINRFLCSKTHVKPSTALKKHDDQKIRIILELLLARMAEKTNGRKTMVVIILKWQKFARSL